MPLWQLSMRACSVTPCNMHGGRAAAASAEHASPRDQQRRCRSRSCDSIPVAASTGAACKLRKHAHQGQPAQEVQSVGAAGRLAAGAHHGQALDQLLVDLGVCDHIVLLVVAGADYLVVAAGLRTGEVNLLPAMACTQQTCYQDSWSCATPLTSAACRCCMSLKLLSGGGSPLTHRRSRRRASLQPLCPASATQNLARCCGAWAA